ncbi:dihydroorotase [Aureisphaera galaxeae]|uniref:dihydroorotase n=1 Tax=Aureisphaera galaxeae TaxID=1538023 RepID=UPI00235103D8|nr:dihydroorotase [Aureisphaera galaxeae]MDC8003973.1 dihydroorotase [Aureisphaera galaxeae]
MDILLKSATIIDPASKHHGKKRDILIKDGVIQKIATSISDTKSTTLSFKNLHVSQGWFDPSVSFGEPGYEERETLENGLQTAAQSGYTAVAVNANTQPVTDSKSQVKFLKTKAYHSPVTVYPIGALTTKSEGVDLAELYDMHSEGAIAFYDYKKPVQNPNLLKIALQYAQNFDGLVQSFPFEKAVATKGVVNEEENSTKLGLKGIPALSEELQITRDLYLLEYTGGKLHIPTISTEKSVKLIKEAKKKGLEVTCSVAVHNLCLTDDVLDSFDTSYKLLPPLRTQKDRKALLKGLADGIIDGITSDHNPIDVENKRTEFDHAYFGSIGLESCFGAILSETDLETAIKGLTGLKKVFGVEEHPIEEGQKANLTLFSPKGDWVFSEESILSTSKNASLVGYPMQGNVYGIVNQNQWVVNE